MQMQTKDETKKTKKRADGDYFEAERLQSSLGKVYA